MTLIAVCTAIALWFGLNAAVVVRRCYVTRQPVRVRVNYILPRRA
ncbi:hypothetical protein [Bradyrhizobium semiaridum]|nr:hypothetical protein [Bradyrhizobium semiaridum]